LKSKSSQQLKPRTYGHEVIEPREQLEPSPSPCELDLVKKACNLLSSEVTSIRGELREERKIRREIAKVAIEQEATIKKQLEDQVHEISDTVVKMKN
jgi:hypothetical protein